MTLRIEPNQTVNITAIQALPNHLLIDRGDGTYNAVRVERFVSYVVANAQRKER